MELTKHGNNANIKINVLPKEEMRKIGFTDYREGYWYLCKRLTSDISFNLDVCKTDSSDWRIDVLDENFCQPYDYQYYLSKENPPQVAVKVNDMVEEIMLMLTTYGIVEGWKPGDYI